MLFVTVDGWVEPREIPLTDIMEIRTRDGSYWVAGLVAGGVVDAVLVTVLVTAYESRDMQFSVGSFK
jgi:hypothetical protein